MKAEIISVGTELLLGEILNTDTRVIAQRLAECGMSVTNQSVVGDVAHDIRRALSTAVSRSDIIIFTGGLGPTEDDITKQTVCEALGIGLHEDKDSLERMKSYFARLGREMSDNNLRQIMVPDGAKVFENDYGVAPGVAITSGGQWIIMLPGPPGELNPMLENKVYPFLREMTDTVMVTRTVRVFGVGESRVAEILGKEMFKTKNPFVGIYCGDGEVKLRVAAVSDNTVAAEALCRPVVNKIVSLLGDNVYSTDDTDLEHTVVKLLTENGLTVSTAESCTAGLLSKRITDVDGSSLVFGMGVSAYNAEVKKRVLGVPEEIIERQGTICKDVAVHMAAGVRGISGSDYAVGITGAAGSPSEGKPSGLVYVAVCDGGKVWVRELNLGASVATDRDKIRYIAASHALDMIRRCILGTAQDGEDMNAALLARASFTTFDPEKQKAAVAVKTQNNDLEWDEEEDKKEELPPFFRFVKRLVPWRGDRVTEIVRKLIFLAAVIALISSSIYLGDYMTGQIINANNIEDARRLYEQDEIARNSDGTLVRFNALRRQNSDIVGWLKIPNTKTDNPVYQAKNNTYYTDHNNLKKSSVYGALFIDSKNVINEEKVSKNITVYGHHMRDGSMLAGLHKYKQIAFYKKNPVVSFDTLYELGEYKVFAAFITNAEEKDDNGYFFNYTVSSFKSNEDFDSWVTQVRRRSLYNTTVDVNSDDYILTLSTCTYELSGVELRFVVCARRIRENESRSVNVTKATVNNKPLYPQIWYNRRGGSKPKFADGQTTWTDGVNRKATTSSEKTSSSKKESSSNTSSFKITSSKADISGNASSKTGSNASAASGSAATSSKTGSDASAASGSAASASASTSSGGDSSDSTTSASTSTQASTSGTESTDQSNKD